MFGDNYKKNHKEYAAEECPIARGRGLGSKRTPDILIRVKIVWFNKDTFFVKITPENEKNVTLSVDTGIK